ncbi:MAG: methyltransferase domain-containing protein [Chloroflexi bacterium]|nr:methyltransferase domain-containing protein [Chloroflexota bacterium]
MVATQPVIDEQKLHAFMGKAVGDLAGASVIAMCAVGDRLGLFKTLASGGPASSAELAARAKVNERYAREWLGGMACAGYLTYDPAGKRFTLPPEQALALAQEASPVFVGGMYELFMAEIQPFGQVCEAFQKGGGVQQGVYPGDFWLGLERFTASWFENLLLQQWIPAVPHVEAKLRQGAVVADVGCGNGKALVKLAQAFPNSRFVGYDAFAPAIATATAKAKEAGVADRVQFQVRDVSKGLTEQYDLITTFDVVHDAVQPRALLKAIRQGLKRDGSYLLLDINCSDKLEENIGPLGAVFHGVSLFYCMTTSLAEHGEGLGTMGLPPSKVDELCKEAGFGSVRRLPLENPFNILYEVRA